MTERHNPDPIIRPSDSEKKKRPIVPPANGGDEESHNPDPIIRPAGAASQNAREAAEESLQANYGLLEGLANLVGMPMDIAQAAVEAEWGLFSPDGSKHSRLPPDSVYLSSDFNKKWLKRLGLIGADPQTGFGRILRKAGEYTGTTLPFAGISGVARGGMAGLELAIKELATGFIAGGTAGMAREAASKSTENEYVQTGAEFVGGLAGLGVTGVTIAGAKRLGGLTKAGRERTANEYAAKASRTIMRESVADPEDASKRILAGAEKADKQPGFKPTTAQIAGDAGLIGLEKELAQSPIPHQKLLEGRFNNIKAQHDLFDSLNVKDVPDKVAKDLIKAKVRVSIDTLEQRAAAYKSALDEAVELGMTPQQASEKFAEYTVELKKVRGETERGLWAAIDPDNEGRWNVAGMKSFADDMLKSVVKTEDPADTPVDVIGRIAKMGKKARGKAPQAEFAEMQALRSDILEKIRAERAKPDGNTNRARKLSLLLGKVEETFGSIEDQSQYVDIAARHSAARAFTRESAELLKEGPARKILREGPQELADTATLDVLFHSRRGSKESAVRLKELADEMKDRLGHDQANSLVRDYAIRTIYEMATDKQGIIKPAVLRKFAPALEQFPEIRDELLNIQKAQKAIDTLIGRAERRTKDVQKGVLGMFMGLDGEEAVAEMLKRPNAAQEAKRIRMVVGNDQDALMGLRRSLWEDFTSKTTRGLDDIGTPFANPQALRQYLKDNEAVFREWGYSERDLETLRRAADQAAMMERTKLPSSINVAGKSDDPTGEFLGIPFSSVMARWYDIQRHRVSPQVGAVALATKLFKREMGTLDAKKVSAILTEAAVNPRIAAELMQPVSVKTAPEAFRRIRASLIAAGVVTANELEEARQKYLKEEFQSIKMQMPTPTAEFTGPQSLRQGRIAD